MSPRVLKEFLKKKELKELEEVYKKCVKKSSNAKEGLQEVAYRENIALRMLECKKLKLPEFISSLFESRVEEPSYYLGKKRKVSELFKVPEKEKKRRAEKVYKRLREQLEGKLEVNLLECIMSEKSKVKLRIKEKIMESVWCDFEEESEMLMLKEEMEECVCCYVEGGVSLLCDERHVLCVNCVKKMKCSENGLKRCPVCRLQDPHHQDIQEICVYYPI